MDPPVYSSGLTRSLPERRPTPTSRQVARWNRQVTRSWAARYAFAIVSVALASGLSWLIWGLIKPQVSPLFFLTVLMSAWYGGLGPGLVATALSGFLSIYIFSDPVFSLDVDVGDMLRVATFSAVAVAVSALADGRRRAEEQLRAAQEGLERRVDERTRELAELNETLKGEVAHRRQAQVALVEHQSRLQDLTDEVVLAEQRERRRIAERLHDEIGQILAVSQIRIGALRDMAGPTAQVKELEAIEGLVEEAISRTRSITCELSPPVLYELGLEAALQWLAGRFRQSGTDIVMQVEGMSQQLSEEAGVTLFHVTRELLANVAKHSQARSVRVVLSWGAADVLVHVDDDGIGFDPASASPKEKPTSFGLFSARERLRRYGGTLDIESSPGRGTHANSRLPHAPREFDRP
jgi:signal transduction histidine kinase